MNRGQGAAAGVRRRGRVELPQLLLDTRRPRGRCARLAKGLELIEQGDRLGPPAVPSRRWLDPIRRVRRVVFWRGDRVRLAHGRLGRQPFLRRHLAFDHVVERRLDFVAFVVLVLSAQREQGVGLDPLGCVQPVERIQRQARGGRRDDSDRPARECSRGLRRRGRRKEVDAFLGGEQVAGRFSGEKAHARIVDGRKRQRLEKPCPALAPRRREGPRGSALKDIDLVVGREVVHPLPRPRTGHREEEQTHQHAEKWPRGFVTLPNHCLLLPILSVLSKTWRNMVEAWVSSMMIGVCKQTSAT